MDHKFRCLSKPSLDSVNLSLSGLLSNVLRVMLSETRLAAEVMADPFACSLSTFQM